MTPNIGLGGNTAIESAVALANSLKKIAESSSPCQTDDIHRCFRDWQSAREPRVETTWTASAGATRLESLTTYKDKILQHLLPFTMPLMTYRMSKSIVGAVKLDSSPMPARALQGSMPYKCQEKPKQQVKEKGWQRALWAVPLASSIGIAGITLGAIMTNMGPHMISMFTQTTWTASSREVIQLAKPVYQIPFLDDLMRPMITCFLPSISGSDPRSWTQMLTFITDVGAVYGIWLLESYRKVHSWPEVLL